MKRFVLFLVMALMIGAEGLAAQQVLTDNDVVKMVQAGVAQDIVLKLIAESPVQFGFQPDRIIRWKQAGIPDDIVRAMMARRADGRLIQYVPFSSEVRVVPAKASRRGLARFEIWRRK